MKKLLTLAVTNIPFILGMVIICVFALATISDNKPSSSTTRDFAPAVTLVFQYAVGDKVLLKIGVIGVIRRGEIVDDKWKLYHVYAIIGNTAQEVQAFEFEIEKKVE